MSKKIIFGEAQNYSIVKQGADGKNRTPEQQINDLKGKVNPSDGDTVEVDQQNFENKVYTKKELKEMRLRNLIENAKIYTKKDLVEQILSEGVIDRSWMQFRPQHVPNGVNISDPYTQFFILINNEMYRSNQRMVSDRNKLINSGEILENPQDLLTLINTPEFQNVGWSNIASKTIRMFGRKVPIDAVDRDIYRNIIIQAQKLPEGQQLANNIKSFVENPGNSTLGQVSQQAQMGVTDAHKKRIPQFLNKALDDDIKRIGRGGDVNPLAIQNITKLLDDYVDGRTDLYKQEKLPVSATYLLTWAALTNQENVMALALMQSPGLDYAKKQYIINAKTVSKRTLEYLMDRNVITREDIQKYYKGNKRQSTPQENTVIENIVKNVINNIKK